MQMIPLAIGQSDGVLVLWEDNPEIGLVFPRGTEVIQQVEWGAGTLGQDDCLILYLFIGSQAVELYLPQRLPTTPEQELDIWLSICNWQPDTLKLRYGRTPSDREREVLLLLPKGPGEKLIDKLSEFVAQMRTRIDKIDKEASRWRMYTELETYLKAMTEGVRNEIAFES